LGLFRRGRRRPGFGRLGGRRLGQLLGEGELHLQAFLGLPVEVLERAIRFGGLLRQTLAHADAEVEDDPEHHEGAHHQAHHLAVLEHDPGLPRRTILHSPSSSSLSIRSGAETPSRAKALAKTLFIQAIRYSLAAVFSTSSEITFSP